MVARLAHKTQTTAVVKPKPHVIATADTICIGDTATISVSGANSYLWTPGNFTTNTLNLTPTLTTSYKVVGTSLGCKDSVNTFIKVNPLPVVSVNSDSICLTNDFATLIAHGAHFYEWSNGIIGDSIIVNPPAQETTYSVVGTDINNCKNNATSTVAHYPLPTIQLTSNTTICAGSQATLTAGGGVSYSWNTTETTSFIVVSPTDSVTTYTVGVTDNNNCFDSASVDVTTIPLPIPFISNEMDTICKGTYTTIIAGGGTSYLWNTGEVTPSISVKPLNSTIYTVTIKTSLNNIVCSKDTSIQQNVRNCNVIYVPNAFMPTGYNTVFKPIGDIAITKSYQFSIYNRWGQLVFETTDVNQGWDGRFNGEYVQAGAYVYYLKIDNGYEEPFEKIGTVTVVQ